jgi:hypothetical protein
MQDSRPVKTFIDDETNASWTSELEYDRVDERNVIWQKKEATGGQVFLSEACHPINCFGEAQSHEVKRPLAE